MRAIASELSTSSEFSNLKVTTYVGVPKSTWLLLPAPMPPSCKSDPTSEKKRKKERKKGERKKRKKKRKQEK